MLDQKIPACPRVALVFGDAESAAHLRDAVSSHVEIVYETCAADFDVSRVAGSQATAALVNLDDCESLDAVETGLQEAGVAVVFNDPEISGKLEGWAQARWLRHLTAKLAGSHDFDPPRPADAPVASAVADAGSAVQTEPETASFAPAGGEAAPQLVERPLSPAEIESMTADFVAVQDPQVSPADPGEAAEGVPQTSDAGNTEPKMPIAVESETGIDASSVVAAGDAVAVAPDGLGSKSEHGEDEALDIDTEALSAMIDARLAAAEGEPAPESPEVWRVVEGGDVSAVDLPTVPEPAERLGGVVATTAPVDESDVLKALPSLDDWQLVDQEAMAAPASAATREEQVSPAISIDFAGLELVPMETVVPIELNSEPIERWMHVSDDKNRASGKERPAVADSKGEHA